jgi:glycosyltransferase involved in cell wall biosynthesis
VKVLHVVASINRDVGGPAVSVSGLATGLAALGVETTVATLDYAEHGPQAALGGARLESVPAGALTRAIRGWSPALERKIAALAHAGTDVVHGHGLWMFPNIYARRAARGAAACLVISPRGMLDDWSLRRSQIRKMAAWNLFERRNLETAALLHATSVAEAKAVRALGLRMPIAIIPNGVEFPVDTAVPGRETLEHLHRELAGKQWLLFMSRLHPKKGIAELVRVWGTLEAQFPTWQLLVAGPDLDGHGAQVRSLVAQLGIAGRVTFAGMLSGPDKACALARSEVMVLPTHSENFGVAVAETLAHATPVVTTRAAPWQELVEQRCGWWIDDREDVLRNTLVEAMSLGTGQRDEMGARGRALVAARYSWNRVAREMAAAYTWILNRGPRPDFVEES